MGAVINFHDISPFHVDVGTNLALFCAPEGWVNLEPLMLAPVVLEFPLAHFGELCGAATLGAGPSCRESAGVALGVVER